MANQIPLSGATNAAGGYLLPEEQGDILINGLLRETGALQLAGDIRATNVRKTKFAIWLGKPTAGPVGEGAAKPVTGAEFGQTEINVKKFASIVLFTDEEIEDVQSGDLNVLVDRGVRDAIGESIDAHMVGKTAGTNIPTPVFDSALRATTASVELGTGADAMQKAISAAMGVLETNGYGNPANMGMLLGFGFNQQIRDARTGADATKALYDGTDPFYGLSRAYSTNLNPVAATAAIGNIVGFVVNRPNIHVRIRKDVTVDASNQATVNDGLVDRNLWQENLTGVRYETRLGVLVHDINRAVVAITNAA